MLIVGLFVIVVLHLLCSLAVVCLCLEHNGRKNKDKRLVIKWLLPSGSDRTLSNEDIIANIAGTRGLG